MSAKYSLIVLLVVAVLLTVSSLFSAGKRITTNYDVAIYSNKFC